MSLPDHGSPGNAAIGIFDSGVGGLSVLRHIQAALPDEHLLYAADAGFAPYGDKSEAVIVARSLSITRFLVDNGVKALVVACNTATAAAIQAIRMRYPALPVVGVEPGLKPAAALSASRTVGVLATAGTLASRRFAQLQAQVTAATGVTFLLQPCPGLADRIEKGELRAPDTARLIERLVHPLLRQGADTLVLGCTHYPFVQPLIEATVERFLRQQPDGGPAPLTRIEIVDTGAAVARQLASRLRAGDGLRAPASLPGLVACTTGSGSTLAHAFQRLLSVTVPVHSLSIGTIGTVGTAEPLDGGILPSSTSPL